MNWVDNTTAILVDGSIINFREDGSVEFHGSKDWKTKHKLIGNVYKNIPDIFIYNSKEKAIAIWEEVERQIVAENNK